MLLETRVISLIWSQLQIVSAADLYMPTINKVDPCINLGFYLSVFSSLVNEKN